MEYIDYGYCRISTTKQNIDRQERNILEHFPAAHIVKVAPRSKDILLYKLSNTFVCAKGAVRLALSAALFAVAVFC